MESVEKYIGCMGVAEEEQLTELDHFTQLLDHMEYLETALVASMQQQLSGVWEKAPRRRAPPA